MRDKAVGILVRLGLVSALVVVALHGHLMWSVQQRYYGNDFGKLYYGVQAWQRGESLYEVTPASVIPAGERSPNLFFRNLNPPHVHLLIWPLVALPLSVATRLWALSNLGRVARWSRFDRRLAAVVLIGASSLTSTSLVTGNYGPLLALPVTLAWLADRRRAEAAVGAWGGLVLAAKPFLGLLAVDWILRRQGRTIVVAALVGLGCLAVGLVTFGLASTLEWVVQLREVQWTWAAMNGSLPGLVSRMFDASP